MNINIQFEGSCGEPWKESSMNILKNIGLGLSLIFMVGLYGMILYRGFFPIDPVEEKNALMVKHQAELRAEAMKEWQDEWLNQQK